MTIAGVIANCAVRGSKDKDRQPIHMISAWVSEQELLPGQMCVEEKTNSKENLPEEVEENLCLRHGFTQRGDEFNAFVIRRWSHAALHSDA